MCPGEANALTALLASCTSSTSTLQRRNSRLYRRIMSARIEHATHMEYPRKCSRRLRMRGSLGKGAFLKDEILRRARDRVIVRCPSSNDSAFASHIPSSPVYSSSTSSSGESDFWMGDGHSDSEESSTSIESEESAEWEFDQTKPMTLEKLEQIYKHIGFSPPWMESQLQLYPRLLDNKPDGIRESARDRWRRMVV